MIIITGANGYLGTHLSRLIPEAYGVVSRAYDLRQPLHIEALFKQAKPDTVFHLAADVGGLTYNLQNPASIYYNNVMMNTLLIHKAALAGCQKFIFVSSVCAYPAYPPLPTREHHLFDGQPEASNLSYGLSKRMALTQLQACKQQYGMEFEYPIFANLYGPGDKSNHVLPDLIRKFLSNQETIEIWGDGSQTRDFLYVTDAANALVWLANQSYGEPLNIASGQSVSLRQIADYLYSMTGYKGTLVWQHNRPIGQMNRLFSTDKAKQLGWQAQTDFAIGLQRMVEWFKLLS